MRPEARLFLSICRSRWSLGRRSSFAGKGSPSQGFSELPPVAKAVTVLSALAMAAVLLAQQPAGPAFDAASIRPADESGMSHPFGFKIEPKRLTVQYYNIGSLLEEAYQLQNYQLKMPADGDKVLQQRFDIEAETENPVSADEMRARLARLMTDRFHVVFHWESQTAPMYRLETLPGGIELKKSETGYAGANSPMGSRGTCVESFWGPMSMDQLAESLTRWMTQKKPVVNHTDVDGYYVMTMSFLQPDCVPTVDGPGADSPEAALKEIGLKLTPANDPIKIMVVEKAGPVEGN